MSGLKKGDLLTIDGGSGSGRSEGFGYNEKGEGITPLKKNGREEK